MAFVSVCVRAGVYYLNLLSAQHGQLPHVPERLQQVVVELSGRLQQLSVRLVLLGVHLQQLHHAVQGFVFVQHLGTEDTERTDEAGCDIFHFSVQSTGIILANKSHLFSISLLIL